MSLSVTLVLLSLASAPAPVGSTRPDGAGQPVRNASSTPMPGLVLPVTASVVVGQRVLPGHVVGAVSLPLSAPDFEERQLTLDRNERYLVYARQDERTGEVADRMVAEGFATVVDAGAFGLLALAGAPVR